MENNAKHIILNIKKLTIGYSSKKLESVVARGINIEVNEPKLICLVGKNGIGKSTLLRTLSGVQPKLSGEIIIRNKNLNTYSSNDLSRIMSLVLTEKLPESNLTVFELIALGRQPYTNWIGSLSQTDIEKINEAMQLTNIEHLSDRKYFELSDGQLQKVLISRALAQDTDIIILDEPTAHLDVQHKMETFLLLKELVDDFGKTIIISTHEIHLAIQSANELWLMTEDEIICGNPQKLIKNESIEKLFSSDKIEFDVKKQQFTLK
ncbi:MAG: ABC transporter ATP-binding protein [Flavobacteriaceae bacterium]|nr:ABC transporter ATP-binding protein [Flavobacteriaceae bacterium]